MIGAILPFIYIFTFFYLFNKSIPATFLNLKYCILRPTHTNHSYIYLATIGVYLLGIFIASLYAIRKFTIAKIQVRKLYQLLFYLFLNIIAIYIFIPSAGFELFYIMAIPLGALLSIYFAECRSSFFSAFLFFILIAAPVLVNFLV